MINAGIFGGLFNSVLKTIQAGSALQTPEGRAVFDAAVTDAIQSVANVHPTFGHSGTGGAFEQFAPTDIRVERLLWKDRNELDTTLQFAGL